jgi:hypothetical protein
LRGEQTEFWDDFGLPEGEEFRVCKKMCKRRLPIDFFPIHLTTVDKNGNKKEYRKHCCKQCYNILKSQSSQLHKKYKRPKWIICPICRKECEKPVLDHDHETAEFRGWICNDCNNALGKFDDDPFVLKRAITYLNNPFQDEVLE